MTTPKQDGFFMPAEWSPHKRTWMMWPCRAEVWDDMDVTRANYVDVAHAIRQFEPLTMVVHPRDRAQAHAMLGSDIELLEHPIDDSWARDAGPNFLIDAQGNKAGSCFSFNAWGGKYDPYDGDDSVGAAILEAAGVPAYSSSLIAEGGGISVDGDGTVLTTETCFPNANRNPDWSREAITEELKQMLGAEKVIWLPGNELEDETDGHVDGIAMFMAPGVVLIEGAGRADNDWYEKKLANLEFMRGQTDAKGREIRLVEVPDAMDAPDDHDMFCESYVNSYLCNGGVVMPQYGIREDGLVAEVYQELFPGRRVVQVPIPSIAIGGGGIHCITQQEPL
ncbi:agmatine deiminase family protein [Roseovarius faecimaris]|nr:agmatine deiminase family protein [Roseovarius faecimaris]